MTWPHPVIHWPTHWPTHPPMGGGVSTNHKPSNRIELSRLDQDLLNFSSFDLTPPIDPLTHPTTHTPTHRWRCLYKSWIFKQHWIVLIRSRFIKFLAIWPEPTHQPTHPLTHPPNYTPTHGWRILHRFQIFKQNWIISISSNVIEFLLIPGVPPLRGGGWMDWDEGGCGCVGVSHELCTCTHTCTCRHTCTHTPTCMLNMIKMDASMSAAMCNFYTCIYVRACMCMCVHACAHVWGHPPCLRHSHPSAPSPELQGAQNTKIQ